MKANMFSVATEQSEKKNLQLALFLEKVLLAFRPVRRMSAGEGESHLESFSLPLEKCVGHILKLFDIVSKIWTRLRKLFALPMSQAGYGPACVARTLKKASRGLTLMRHDLINY